MPTTRLFVAAAALSHVLFAQSPQSIAQMPTGNDLLPPVTPIHTAPADPGGLAYGTWAAGRDYKVSFHGDMTYVPYLGQEYPQNQPFSWRTVAVTAGGTPLPALETPLQRWHDEHRYEYRCGDFVETYDVRQSGLEQSFVFGGRPATPGAIVVTGRITTELAAGAFGARHGAIEFTDANDLTILSYGASVAFDRSGRRVDVLTSFDGERISLTVPAAFVETAVFPLTIDPIISTTTVVGGGGLLNAADVVRDDRYNRVAICHTRYASFSDADCWVREWPDALTPNSGDLLFTDLQANWSTDEIAGAVADSPQRYCFVMRREFGDGSSRIRYHVRDTGDQTLSSAVIGIYGPPGTMEWRVDIGGTTMSSSGNSFALVWQRDLATSNTGTSRIHGAIVDAQSGVSTPVAFAPTPLYVSTDCESPSINQSERITSNTPVTWVVCWQESISDGPWGAAVRKVDDSPSVSLSYLRWDGIQHLQPKLAGAAGRYAIAYGAAGTNQLFGATTRRSGYGLQVRRFDWPHGGAPVSQPARRIKSHIGAQHREWRTTGMAFDHDTQSHWLVTYVSDSFSAGSGNGYAARIGYRGFAVEEDILLHDNSNQPWTGAKAGGACYDDDAKEFVAVTAVDYNPSSGAVAHRIGPAAVGPAGADGYSCSPAGISWVGYGNRQQIGCEFSRVRVTNAPADTLHVLMVSLDLQDVILNHPIVAPGCRLHLDTITSAYLGTMPLAVGSTVEWQFPLPEFLDPGTIYFQDWHLDASGTVLEGTSRLEVPIAK